MPEPNGAPDWLDQAERDAKAAIERLYIEGRTALTDDPANAAPTPQAPAPPAHTAPPPATPPPAAPPVAPPPGRGDSAAAAVLAAAAAAEQEQPGAAEPTWPDSGPAAHRRVDGTEPR